MTACAIFLDLAMRVATLIAIKLRKLASMSGKPTTTFQTGPLSAASQSEVKAQMAERLGTALATQLQQVYATDQRKSLRRFSATEVADLFGISRRFLRKCHAEGTSPELAENRNG